MKVLLTVLSVFLIISCNNKKKDTGEISSSKESEKIGATASCNFVDTQLPTDLVGFASDNDAESALKRIMKFTGLPANFQIKAANVPNACAVIDGTKRYILYSQEFMEKVRSETNSNWSEISILAHEIGHHLSGHTLESTGSRPSIELEADKFSGFILSKMGASLDESLLAMKTLSSEEASSTHPAKSARLAAIANGWKQAQDANVGTITPTAPPSNTTTPVTKMDTSYKEPEPQVATRTIASAGYYIANGSESRKIYFHNMPDATTRRAAYITTQETVYVEKVENGFGYIEFTNTDGRTSYGWVQMQYLIKKPD